LESPEKFFKDHNTTKDFYNRWKETFDEWKINLQVPLKDDKPVTM